MELKREQALEILKRFDYFQGRRSGRELWQIKPFEVQEQDVANFSRDVNLLIAYIEDITHQVELWVSISKNYQRELDELVDVNMVLGGEVERLTEENENLHASCTELERKCASLNDECADLRAIAEQYQRQFEDCGEDRAKLAEENERLRVGTIECVKKVYRFMLKYVDKLSEIDEIDITIRLGQIAEEMLGDNNEEK